MPNLDGRSDTVGSIFKPSLTAAIAYFSAALFISVAASQNVLYGWALGAARSEITSWIFAAGSLAAALAAPVCLSIALSERLIRRALVAGLLGLLCLAYSTLSSLGFTSVARESVAADRAAIVETIRRAQSRHDAAALELRQLTGAKSTVWRARRAAELQAIMDDAAAAIREQPPVRDVDPQAASIAFWLSMAGLEVRPETVAMILPGLITCFFELASALSLCVASATGAPLAPATSETAAEVPAAPEKPASAPENGRDDVNGDDPPPPPTIGKRGRPRKVALGEAVRRIEANGGKVSGTLRGIGQILGTGSVKPTTHKLLCELRDLGAITFVSGPNGVHVALA